MQFRPTRVGDATFATYVGRGSQELRMKQLVRRGALGSQRSIFGSQGQTSVVGSQGSSSTSQSHPSSFVHDGSGYAMF